VAIFKIFFPSIKIIKKSLKVYKKTHLILPFFSAK
jgi:hypothetical protein